jgi:hypothetical protein
MLFSKPNPLFPSMLPHPEGIERGRYRSPKPTPSTRALLGQPPRLLVTLYPQILTKSLFVSTLEFVGEFRHG